MMTLKEIEVLEEWAKKDGRNENKKFLVLVLKISEVGNNYWVDCGVREKKAQRRKSGVLTGGGRWIMYGCWSHLNVGGGREEKERKPGLDSSKRRTGSRGTQVFKLGGATNGNWIYICDDAAERVKNTWNHSMGICPVKSDPIAWVNTVVFLWA